MGKTGSDRRTVKTTRLTGRSECGRGSLSRHVDRRRACSIRAKDLYIGSLRLLGGLGFSVAFQTYSKKQGDEVCSLTLTGLGEGSHLLSKGYQS
jgi:hypothetical protein